MADIRYYKGVMKSKINVYDVDISNVNIRYAIGKERQKTLYVIAMNPSVATDTVWDQTVLKTFGLSFALGYDGCIIFNLLPIRESKSKNLPKKTGKVLTQEVFEKNIEVIISILCKSKQQKIDILACWGDKISENNLMKQSLNEITTGIEKIIKKKQKKVKWYALKDTSLKKRKKALTEKGNPRHLSHLTQTTIPEKFDIKNYLSTLLDEEFLSKTVLVT